MILQPLRQTTSGIPHGIPLVSFCTAVYADCRSGSVLVPAARCRESARLHASRNSPVLCAWRVFSATRTGRLVSLLSAGETGTGESQCRWAVRFRCMFSPVSFSCDHSGTTSLPDKRKTGRNHCAVPSRFECRRWGGVRPPAAGVAVIRTRTKRPPRASSSQWHSSPCTRSRRVP